MSVAKRKTDHAMRMEQARMSTKNRNSRWLLALTIVAMVAALVVTSTRHKPTLLEQSTRICAVDAPPSFGLGWIYHPTYSWATPTQVMFWRGGHTVVHDLARGTETSWEDFYRLLSPSQQRRWDNQHSVQLRSFNGDKLMFEVQLLQSIRSSSPLTNTPTIGGLREAARLTSQLPPDATVAALALSRDEKRIALLVREQHLVPWQTLLRRVLPFYQPAVSTDLVLYTSTRIGALLHVVGREVLPGVQRKTMTAPNDELLWTPDGKHISFIFNKTLYTIKPD